MAPETAQASVSSASARRHTGGVAFDIHHVARSGKGKGRDTAQDSSQNTNGDVLVCGQCPLHVSIWWPALAWRPLDTHQGRKLHISAEPREPPLEVDDALRDLRRTCQSRHVDSPRSVDHPTLLT